MASGHDHTHRFPNGVRDTVEAWAADQLASFATERIAWARPPVKAGWASGRRPEGACSSQNRPRSHVLRSLSLPNVKSVRTAGPVASIRCFIRSFMALSTRTDEGDDTAGKDFGSCQSSVRGSDGRRRVKNRRSRDSAC